MGVSNRPCPYCEDGVTVFDEVADKCHECGWHTCSTPFVGMYNTPKCPDCGEVL